jgi:regulator of protease activity HflC (stomatin/prohibitin superfamily)
MGMLKIKWKNLLITLALGVIPTTISYIIGWWWGGTFFLLLTVLAALLTFPAKLRPVLFSIYAAATIAVVLGGMLDGSVIPEWEVGGTWRMLAIVLVSFVVGVVATAIFWLFIFAVSVKFMLKVTDSLHISFGEALKYMAAVTFDLTQPFIRVEDGEVSFEHPKGMISNLGGPGLLVISPGSAAVLECAGKITRIVGPGLYPLKRFEYFWKPVETKGVIDLRPQFAGDVAKKVRTKDGVELDIEVGTFFQLEPTHITDQKPGSKFAGGDATSEVIGDPEFPVYKKIIEKSLFKVPRGGWKSGWFPSDPIHHLRDVVATYTLDQIFSLDQFGDPLSLDQSEDPLSLDNIGSPLSPDKRVIKEIENEVKKRFDPSDGGVWFKGIDIREITMPEEMEQQLQQRWTSRIKRQIKIVEAAAESRAMIERSKGRSISLAATERVKSRALAAMVSTLQQMLNALTATGSQQIAVSFVNVIQELSSRIGQDESVALRYIDAMQGIMQSEGPKSFVITPPTAAPGFMPSPPTPTLQSGKTPGERARSGEGKQEEEI